MVCLIEVTLCVEEYCYINDHIVDPSMVKILELVLSVEVNFQLGAMEENLLTKQGIALVQQLLMLEVLLNKLCTNTMIGHRAVYKCELL